MNKLKQLVGSTKFHVFLGNPAESQPIEIRKDGNMYYRIELGKKFKIGGFYGMVQLLHRYDARLAAVKGNRFKAYQFFFSKKDAINMLKEGYSVISLEMLSTLSFDESYNQIVSSNGKIYEIESIPPGSYAIALNEPRLPKTFKQVKAERLFAKALEGQKENADKSIQETEEKEQDAQLSESVSKDGNNNLWKFVLTGAACFLGGTIATTAYFLNK